MTFEIRRVGHGDAIATHGPVVFRVVRTATTEHEDIDEARAIIDAAFERYANVGAFVVVEHGAPVPSAAVRRYASKVFGQFGDRLIMCHVTLGLGFWASTARLAIATITRLTGSPALLAGTVEEGAARLSTELVGVDPATLIWVHGELTRQMSGASGELAS